MCLLKAIPCQLGGKNCRRKEDLSFMLGNYTNEINDWFFDLEDRDLADIWDRIENTPEEETAEQWRRKLEELARTYSLSSRFALMRLIRVRAAGCHPGAADTEESFVVQGAKRAYSFSKVTMEYAERMPRGELSRYRELLLELASRREGFQEDRDRSLIEKALRIGARTAALSREEAFRLGHLLGFRLQEMSWFLLRVFDCEDGFRCNMSGDLIEAYCFLTGEGPESAEQLKGWYASMAGQLEKAGEEERPEQWTRKTGSSLKALVKAWEERAEGRQEAFCQWLERQAPYLDRPSRTAADIYRNLAAYVWRLGEGKGEIPEIPQFADEVRRLCGGGLSGEARELLMEEGRLSRAACEKAGVQILKRYKDLFTSAGDFQKAWRAVTATEKGKPRLLLLAGRAQEEGGGRICQLMQGEIQVEKHDMLHLLWYGFCLCWMEYAVTKEGSALFNSLADFTETAEYVLDAALLPAFYPPHLMERSMLLSIVVSCADGTGEPAFAYAELCESLIARRDRGKKE